MTPCTRYHVRLRCETGTWSLRENENPLRWVRNTHDITWTTETTRAAAEAEVERQRVSGTARAVWIEEEKRS